MRKSAIFGIILVVLVVPFAGAIGPDTTRQAGPVLTAPDSDLTAINITNQSSSSRFAISPTPIDVKVEISDTSLPGPKGEMAAGPRAIGFSADPVSIAVLAIIIIAVAAGVWYLAKRKPDEPEENDEENGN